MERGSTANIQEDHKRLFPLQVIWYLWEEGVVPVLQSDENSSINLGLGGVDGEIKRLKESLRNQFIEAGFLPGTASVASEEESVDEDSSSEETLPDGDLNWPEGHPRLTYPTVD